ncbi:MAG: YihY/virulence factor BrkB family protein [Bacteroidota bacterium]
MIEFFINTVKVCLRCGEVAWFYVRGIARKIKNDDILFLASGLSFNGILTMIPLMLLSASALGVFLNSSELSIQQLHGILDTIFPQQPFATNIKESILTVISDIITYRTSLGIFGALVLIWSATSLFDALRSVLHTVYGIPRTRGLFAGMLRHVGFVLLVFLLFIATNISLWLFSIVENVAINVPALQRFDFTWLSRNVPTAVVVLLTALMFYIIYQYIPDTKPPRIAGVISTITTTVLWVISGRVFAIYLSEFSAFSKIYGAYAFILVLLLWIYYSSIVFILGGIVGQTYWERLKLKEVGALDRWV